MRPSSAARGPSDRSCGDAPPRAPRAAVRRRAGSPRSRSPRRSSRARTPSRAHPGRSECLRHLPNGLIGIRRVEGRVATERLQAPAICSSNGTIGSNPGSVSVQLRFSSIGSPSRSTAAPTSRGNGRAVGAHCARHLDPERRGMRPRGEADRGLEAQDAVEVRLAREGERVAAHAARLVGRVWIRRETQQAPSGERDHQAEGVGGRAHLIPIAPEKFIAIRDVFSYTSSSRVAHVLRVSRSLRRRAAAHRWRAARAG